MNTLPTPPCSVIAIVDMDAFYAHVEIANNPELKVCMERGGIIGKLPQSESE